MGELIMINGGEWWRLWKRRRDEYNWTWMNKSDVVKSGTDVKMERGNPKRL